MERRRFLISAAIGGTSAALLGKEVIRDVVHGARLGVLRSEKVFTPDIKEEIPNYSVLFGITLDDDRLASYDQNVSTIGFPPQIVNYFLRGFGERDQEKLEIIRETAKRGILPMISWGERTLTEEKGRQLAQTFRDLNTPFIFRPYYEVNGPWRWPWYGISGPDDFRQRWSLLRRVFREEGLTNAAFCFSPNARTELTIAPLEEYFPGDGDLSAIDGYNKFSYLNWKSLILRGEAQDALALNLSPEEVFGHDLATIQRLSKKPFGISEFNISREDGREQWIVDTMKLAVQAGARFIMPYLRDETKKEGFNWNHQEAQNALKRELKEPYYAVNNPTPLTTAEEIYSALLNQD